MEQNEQNVNEQEIEYKETLVGEASAETTEELPTEELAPQEVCGEKNEGEEATEQAAEKPKKKKDKKKKAKLAFKIIGVILALIILFVAVTTLVSVVGNFANTRKAKSFEPVSYKSQLIPEEDEDGNWYFKSDEDIKVLQLTDVHIGGGWLSLKKDAMAINAVAAMVSAEKPDLVIVTGDIGYPVPFQAGTFNNKSSAKIFATLMEKLGVYWTLAFGNHDTEAYSYYSREDMSEFYSSDKYTYCLYKAGPEDVDGFGNQVISVRNTAGLVTQAMFIFDSHSYTGGDYFGIFWKYDNIHQNQIDWYEESLGKINAWNNKIYSLVGYDKESEVKSSAFFHIPLTEVKDAWYEYVNNGFEDTEDVKYVYGEAGEGKKVVYCGMKNDGLFEKMLELGSTKAIFFGHDHLNNFSIEYKGIRLTYGKSVDYLAYPGIYKLGTQRGCTVITYRPDGSFDCTAESYYQDKYVSAYDKEEVTMQEIVQVDKLKK